VGGRGRHISKFAASLVYTVSSRTARATKRNPVLKKTNKQTNKQTNKLKKNYFCYSWFFVFPDEFENFSLYVFEELCQDVLGDCIESVDCF
jgi:hypothetical protein